MWQQVDVKQLPCIVYLISYMNSVTFWELLLFETLIYELEIIA